MMRKEVGRSAAYRADVVFQPALTPMEASVLPARERTPVRRGALRMAQDERLWARVLGREDCFAANQRQKICVRYT